MSTLKIIDSHTGGEPTRLVLSGFPDLGTGSLAERRERFASQFDHLRRAIVCEPRGSDVIVGALLQAPVDPRAVAAVIFFNNVGTLGMCGHGAIGVIRSLHYLGKISPGSHYLETPVGTVGVRLYDDGRVSIDNVPSWRYAKNVEVPVDGVGTVTGDIAWGGNWFFITTQTPHLLQLDQWRLLTDYSQRIREALSANGITGAHGEEIDHIEINGASPNQSVSARNFVLCPGLAFDRSPCGTGTSAKVACLAADGKLAAGEIWRQESIVGSVFEASWQPADEGRVLPTITGTAYVTALSELVFEQDDAFTYGFAV